MPRPTPSARGLFARLTSASGARGAARLSARGLLLGLALLVVLPGCDHSLEPDGPNLIDRFGPFRLVTPLAASTDAVDFASGERVVFTAEFNKQVAWVVEITGQESGAVKRIEGFSRALDADNASWQGSTTELPFFKDEAVVAVLSVPLEPESEDTTADVTVTSARAYPGTVFADFESGTGSISVGNFEFELQNSGITSEVPAGEGDAFYLLRGTEPPAGGTRNFFVGLIDIRPEGRGVFAAPTSVPEDLYFNFLLRGLGRDFTIAVIQLIVDGNGTGQYELDQDTVFPFGDIPATFTGWQLFSKSVAEIGLTQEQAQNIVAVRAVLISDNNAQPATPQQVSFGLDYITFTAGSPLQP